VIELGDKASPFQTDVHILSWDSVWERGGDPHLRLYDARVRTMQAPMGFEKIDVTAYIDGYVDADHDTVRSAMIEVLNPKITMMGSDWQEITGTIANAHWYTDELAVAQAMGSAMECEGCADRLGQHHKIGAPYMPPGKAKFIGRPVLLRVTVNIPNDEED
jgi:hypothetical protein